MSPNDQRIVAALERFWRTRRSQSDSQGARMGRRDAGSRAAVTGGAQMDGFVDLLRTVVMDAGLGDASIHCKEKLALPGWYRAEKQ
jgi:hypothetical protein